MISFSEAELLAWVTPFIWPFIRALALFSAMPVLGTRVVPNRVRIGLAALIVLADGWNLLLGSLAASFAT